MADLKPLARIVRWATSSTIHNLSHIPADRQDWKPAPTCKSALQVVGEVAGVMERSLPVFTGGEFEFKELPVPASFDEAVARLKEASEAYAAALDNAGDELERMIETPVGPMWGSYAVVFGMVDLLHHHGQLTYIQSLLGDAEVHRDMEAFNRYFAPPTQESGAAGSTGDLEE
jgi:uncharacterized damage-inducible protein DinB